MLLLVVVAFIVLAKVDMWSYQNRDRNATLEKVHIFKST